MFDTFRLWVAEFVILGKWYMLACCLIVPLLELGNWVCMYQVFITCVQVNARIIKEQQTSSICIDCFIAWYVWNCYSYGLCNVNSALNQAILLPTVTYKINLGVRIEMDNWHELLLFQSYCLGKCCKFSQIW